MNVPRLFAVATALAIHAAAIYAAVHRAGSFELSDSGQGTGDLTVVATVTMDDGELFATGETNSAAREAAAASKPVEAPPQKPEEKAEPARQEAREPQQQEARPLPADPVPVTKPDETSALETPPERTEASRIAAAQAASMAAAAQEERRAAAQSEARRGRLASVYGNNISISLGRSKINPHSAQTGRVLVEFTIAPSGQLMTHVIVKSSGYETLDRAALASLEKAAPFPPIPRDLGAAPLTLRVPFEYTAR